MNGKKLLITGFSGFVARHFIDFLYEQKLQVEVYGIDVNEPGYDLNEYKPYLSISFKKIDMTNISQLDKLFEEFVPDYVLHLAAFSSVAYSWKDPAGSFMNNSNIFLNLINEVKTHNEACRILSVGSSEEYGYVTSEDLPLKEKQPLNPTSPYAVARVSQEMLSKIFADTYGLEIVLTRSFNHMGPRQDTRFVVPSFVKRILDIKMNGAVEGEIETGDITVVRDFVDVRDVVRAYYLLLLDGRSGDVYNICSGRPVALKKLIEMIAEQVGVKVTTRVNPDFVRPKDNPVIVGSAFKIESELDWYPEISLKETIRDMIKYMEENYKE